MVGMMLRSFFPAIILVSLATSAHATCENGLRETKVSDAKIEYGTISYRLFNRPGVYVERTFPAITKTMTQTEYQQLPKLGKYKRNKRILEKVKSKPISLTFGDIAEFDYIYWPDGTVATRKVKQNFRRDIEDIEDDEVTVGMKDITVEETFTRPAPVELPDGQLKVMISPSYFEPWLPQGRVSKVTRKYVISRTPAKFQLSFCN
jgi:hypothetical protein